MWGLCRENHNNFNYINIPTQSWQSQPRFIVSSKKKKNGNIQNTQNVLTLSDQYIYFF